MQHQSIVDLLEKHVDADHVGYVADMTELIERAFLNEYYILKCVADCDNEEAKHIEGLKLGSTFLSLIPFGFF